VLKFIVYKVTLVCARACGDARQAASTLLERDRAAAVRAAARTCAMHVAFAAFCCVCVLGFWGLGVRRIAVRKNRTTNQYTNCVRGGLRPAWWDVSAAGRKRVGRKGLYERVFSI